MDTIRELFYGNIHPFERDVPKDSEGDKLNQLIIRHTATLKAMLNEQEMQIVERLVSDPELKTTPAGVSVTSFRIAVERNYADKDGKRKADFFDIVAWRGTAKFICGYFGKGSLVLVEGQLQSRTYQTKNGDNRTVVEIVAENVYFTGERRMEHNQQPENAVRKAAEDYCRVLNKTIALSS